MAALPTVAGDGLLPQNVDTLDPSKLTPLTPEVISRQVMIEARNCVFLLTITGHAGFTRLNAAL